MSMTPEFSSPVIAFLSHPGAGLALFSRGATGPLADAADTGAVVRYEPAATAGSYEGATRPAR
jgi:hypothetical protein